MILQNRRLDDKHNWPWTSLLLLTINGCLIWENSFASLNLQFSSVQFSRSVMSDSLRPHESQNISPPCPSATPGVYSNSCPSSRWCHPTISSSVVPFSSCLQSFPASGSFPMSQFFVSSGQSIGVSISASVLPMSIQVWFPLGLTDLISLQSKGLKSLLQHHSSKASILQHSSFLYSPTLTALTRQTFVDKVIGNISYGL